MHTGGKRYLAGPASGVTPQSRPAPTRNPADATLPPHTMKPMRCTHACQCLCAQAFTAMTFYTLQPNFHGKSYFFITFDRKNIFNDFRKFQSFRAQRGAKFFDFRRK